MPLKVVFYLMTGLSVFPAEDVTISNLPFLNSGSILNLDNSYTGSLGFFFFPKHRKVYTIKHNG